MSLAHSPKIVTNGLVLALDAANTKSLNIPSQSNHGYADWYCLVSSTVTYSIINPAGGIIYERNGSTITPIITATGPQRGTFSVTADRFYYGSVPINLVAEDAHQSIVPLTLLGTQFWNVATRYNPSTYYVYSPYQSATVNFYDNTVGGLTGTPTSTLSLSAGQSGTFTSNNLTNHWISSNAPIVATLAQSGGDKTILSPMSNYVYQRFQQYLNTTNNTTPTTNNFYVTYDSAYKVMNMTIADGSGGDCAQGLGLEYLSDTYSWGNVVSDYTIVFPYTATIVTSYWNGSTWVIWDTHTNITGSITNPTRITRDGTNGPGIEASGIAGPSTNMASSATLWKWEGTAPFYLNINDNTDDEFSVLGWINSTQSSPRSGNTWRDLSGNGNNATLTNGPTYSSANNGNLVFDGVDDYVSSNISFLMSNMTLGFWLYLDDTIDWATRFDIMSGSIAATTNGRFLFYNSSPLATNSLTLFTLFPSSTTISQIIVISNANTLFTGKWKYVTITSNTVSTTTTLSVYIDGALYSSLVVAEAPTATNTAAYFMRNQAGTRPTKGKLSNISMYNRALSAAEIQQNFNALRGRYGI